MKYIEVLIN